jgi:hypothetical protein
MRIKKKELRKRLAQLPINYPAPTIDLPPFDYESEKERVENFCKRLAHNEVEVRDEVLGELPRFLKDVTRSFADREKKRRSAAEITNNNNNSSPVAEDKKDMANLELVFLKLALGIFYCFWHSDKPLVQHACAQKIAELLHCPQTDMTRALLLRAIITVLCREWCKIDRYRMDKYMALVRKIMHEVLVWLLAGSSTADAEASPFFSDERGHYRHVVATFQQLVDAQTSVGLLMHVCDICLDEFIRVRLPPALFARLAQDIPLFAMSKGNYVEKRVLDFFISPMAGGKLHPAPEEEEDDEAGRDVNAKPVSELAAKRQRLQKRQRDEARAAHLAWELEILAVMSQVCRDFSVAATTVRPVRAMFAEAQLLLHGALTSLQPKAVQPPRLRITRQSKQIALDREVQEADANRIAVVLARRDGKKLRQQDQQAREDQPQRKKARHEASAEKKGSKSGANLKEKEEEEPSAGRDKKKNADAEKGKVKRTSKRRKEYIMSKADYDDSGNEAEEEEF